MLAEMSCQRCYLRDGHMLAKMSCQLCHLQDVTLVVTGVNCAIFRNPLCWQRCHVNCVILRIAICWQRCHVNYAIFKMSPLLSPVSTVPSLGGHYVGRDVMSTVPSSGWPHVGKDVMSTMPSSRCHPGCHRCQLCHL